MSRVIPTIEGMLDYAKTLNKNLFIDANIKPTLDSKHMQMLVDDDEKFHEYYTFFDELYAKMRSKVNFDVGIGVPTLVVPHYHTTEDGILLKKFLHKINENFGKYDSSLFLQFHEDTGKILRDEFQFTACSAGVDSLPIDYNGHLYGCHALFKLDYDGNEERVRLG
jgi:hypothetical protein